MIKVNIEQITQKDGSEITRVIVRSTYENKYGREVSGWKRDVGVTNGDTFETLVTLCEDAFTDTMSRERVKELYRNASLTNIKL